MKRTRYRKRLRKTKTQKRRNTRRIKRAGNLARFTRSVARMAPMARRFGTELGKEAWTTMAKEGAKGLNKAF